MYSLLSLATSAMIFASTTFAAPTAEGITFPPHSNIIFKLASNPSECLSPVPNAPTGLSVILADCATTLPSDTWTLPGGSDANTQIVSLSTGACIGSSADFLGATTLETCTSFPGGQTWIFNSANGTITIAEGIDTGSQGKCLTSNGINVGIGFASCDRLDQQVWQAVLN